MKKYSIFKIFLLAIFLLLIINFLYHFIYLGNFHKHIAPITDAEKQKTLEILNKSIDLDSYQIKIGNVYTGQNRNLIQVELVNGTSKKYYLVDLKDGKVIKR
jgi:hypothetical protein